MFQRLYKHLDDISASLRQKDDSTGTANQTREKILEQLQQLNDSIRLREAEQASAQRKLAGSIALGGGLVVLCIAALIFVEVRIHPTAARETGQPLTHQTGPSPSETPTEDPRYHEKMQRLDSLVAEQSQSIKELKELNKSAIYSLRRIRKHFDDLDKKAEQQIQPPDSPATNTRNPLSVSTSDHP
jgi:CHASE3 domain sensor protein